MFTPLLWRALRLGAGLLRQASCAFDMPYCRNCGYQVEAGANFCRNCGQRQPTEAAASPQQEAFASRPREAAPQGFAPQPRGSVTDRDESPKAILTTCLTAALMFVAVLVVAIGLLVLSGLLG